MKKSHGCCGGTGHDDGFTDIENGLDHAAFKFGEVVLVGASDLLDQSMVAQAFEKTGGTRRGQAGDPGAKVTSPEAADAPLAPGQGEEQLVILVHELVEAAPRAPLVADWTRDPVNRLPAGIGGVDGGDEIKVAVIGCHQQSGEIGQAVDVLAQVGELSDRLAFALFHPAVKLEIRSRRWSWSRRAE